MPVFGHEGDNDLVSLTLDYLNGKRFLSHLAQVESAQAVPAFDLLIQFYELGIVIIRNINGVRT